MENIEEVDKLRAKFLRLRRLLRNPRYDEKDKEKIQNELNEVEVEILKLSSQTKK